MSKTIRMSLSKDSIQNAINELEAYKNSLQFKTSIFVQRLGEEGLKVVDERKNNFRGDSNGSDLQSYVWLTYEGNFAMATLVLAGKDVAFIEFGSGIHYNTSAGSSMHPKGQDLGMTIGSYGQGKGQFDSWVYFDEELGRYKTSHGTGATMPVYGAYESIKDKFYSIAKEVFG